MARIAIIDRADMNAEQARVYDAAKDAGGPVAGRFYAYIRLPNCSRASTRCGPRWRPARCPAVSSRS